MKKHKHDAKEKKKKEKKEEHQHHEEKNKIEEEKKEIEAVEKLEQEIKDLKDTLLRRAAEFENYKRRTENEQMNLIKYGAESFILKIIPIYDDLQRSIQHFDENKNNLDAIKDGLKLVLDKFTKTFEEQGIKKIETEGKEFDVEFHDALLQQPSTEVPPNTVIQEVEPGYTFKDKVIKHAKVIVSTEPEQPEKEEKETEKNKNEEQEK